jgi:hypothetical protein
MSKCPLTIALLIFSFSSYGAEPEKKPMAPPQVEVVVVPKKQIEEVNAVIRIMEREKDDLIYENMMLKRQMDFLHKELKKGKCV